MKQKIVMVLLMTSGGSICGSDASMDLTIQFPPNSFQDPRHAVFKNFVEQGRYALIFKKKKFRERMKYVQQCAVALNAEDQELYNSFDEEKIKFIDRLEKIFVKDIEHTLQKDILGRKSFNMFKYALVYTWGCHEAVRVASVLAYKPSEEERKRC